MLEGARIGLKVDVDTLRGTREGVPRLAALFKKHGGRRHVLFFRRTGSHRARDAARVSQGIRAEGRAHLGAQALRLEDPDVRRAAAGTRHRPGGGGGDARGARRGIRGGSSHLRSRALAGHGGRRRCELDPDRVRARHRGFRARVRRSPGLACRGRLADQRARAGARERAWVSSTPAIPGAAARSFPLLESGAEHLPADCRRRLPTFDELLGRDGIEESNIAEALFSLSADSARASASTSAPQVFTLHAELEGMLLRDAFESLLVKWRAAGASIVGMAPIHAEAMQRPLPVRRVILGEIAGRSGSLAVQAAEGTAQARGERRRGRCRRTTAGASSHGARYSRFVGAGRRPVAGDAAVTAAVQSGRGALCGDSARDARERRLDHPAPERPRLHRKAAAAVLGHGAVAAICSATTSSRRACTPRSRRLGSILAVALAARRLWGGAAALRAAAVLAGMLLFVILGQLLTLDMSLTLYMTCALAAFLAAQSSTEQGRSARGWMLSAWTAVALGVLTKGLVAAAIPAAVLMLYSAYTRDFGPWRRLHAAAGLPLFLAITVPWHWLAAAAASGFSGVLLRARALGALPDAERGSRGALVVLRRRVLARQPALDAAGAAGAVPRLASAGRAARFRCHAVSQDLGVVRMRVLLPVRLEAHALHPARDAGARAAHRLAPCERARAGSVAYGDRHGGDRDRRSRSSACSRRATSPPRTAAPISWRCEVRWRRSRCCSRSRACTCYRAAAATPREPPCSSGAGWCLAGLLAMRAASAVAPIYSGVAIARAFPERAAGRAPLQRRDV